MDILKKIIKYVILLIFLYIIVSIFTAGMISKTYKEVDSYEILANKDYGISIDSAENTAINGYVKGNIKNNTEELKYNPYLKISYYNDKNNYLGTNIVKLDSIQTGESQEFKDAHRYNSATSFTIDVINEEVAQDLIQQLEDIKRHPSRYGVTPVATNGMMELVAFFMIMWIIYII